MNFFLTIVLDGLIQASWLFIVAVGLTLVFGVLKILNIAHGSFYALGAYAAASFVGWAATMKWAPGFSLVAYAMFLILEDVTKLVWGANPYYVSEPYALFGNLHLGVQTWVGYDFALVAL